MNPGTYKVVIRDNCEHWYDANGNIINSKDSGGNEYLYDANEEPITKEEFDAIHSPCH